MPQGTIKNHEDSTRSGVLLDDAGTELSYTYDSYRGSPVRNFRIGQRVRFELEGSGPSATVRNLNIITL